MVVTKRYYIRCNKVMGFKFSKDKKTIAILFGGISTEHEVSVITGLQVLNNINRDKYNVIPIYVSKSGVWLTGNHLATTETYANLDEIPLKSAKVNFDLNQPKYISVKSGLFNRNIKIDTAILCFHGGSGENGSVQGMLELMQIPYTGAGVLGSSIGIDKVLMKEILIQNDIFVVKHLYFYDYKWNSNQQEVIRECEAELQYPMFVKPASSGSSIGITKVKNAKELVNAINVAFQFDEKIIIEQGIEGYKEINISVFEDANGNLKVSEIEEVFSSNEFLNYDDKYKSSGTKSQGMASTKREIPAQISPKTKSLIEDIGRKTFKILNANGLARIDFLVNEKLNKYYVIEINTIPGSLSFYLWKPKGVSFTSLIDKMVESAIARYDKQSKKVSRFNSNILQNFDASLKAPKVGG